MGGLNEADLGDGCWLERLIVDVRLNALDDGIRDVVFVELEQAVEEFLRLCQQTFARLPVIVPLLARLCNPYILTQAVFYTHPQL